MTLPARNRLFLVVKYMQCDTLCMTFSAKLEFHFRTSALARVSFQVTRLWNVLPVSRSHVMNVLRCVDKPRHAISFAVRLESMLESNAIFEMCT